MVRFLKWLEETVPAGKVTEVGILEKLIELRARGDLFRGPSFATIASYKEHGAIIHYEPTPETDVAIGSDGILLVDSGGQYLDGTTDITRTIAMGEPTAEQKDRFTRVLKGLIRLIVQPFPEGTAGRQIDALSRLSLWDAGINFMHGVGHGIGSHLCVHEGPQAISYYRCTGVALEPGMACTIEPGFYKDGEYGLRTENVAVVRDAPEVSTGDSAFRRFEDITLCPIDLKLVEKSLLTESEVDWLNEYHRKVCEALSPHLSPEEAAWLGKNTQPF
jgi:Xaa-Pro aminopeptidase